MPHSLRLWPELPPAEVLAVLEDALTPKRDGTRHHRSCLNRTTNASPIPCSPRCVRANELLAWLAARRPAETRMVG